MSISVYWARIEDFDCGNEKPIEALNESLGLPSTNRIRSRINSRYFLIHALKEFGVNRTSLKPMAFGKSGKPRLQGESLSFSLSHSKDFVAVAISREYEVGLDIEVPRHLNERSRKKVIKYVVGDNENDQLFTLLPDETSNFFRIWTIKESAVKCIGEGLKYSFKDVLIDSRQQIVHLRENTNIESTLHIPRTSILCFRELDLSTEFYSSLAYAPSGSGKSCAIKTKRL